MFSDPLLDQLQMPIITVPVMPLHRQNYIMGVGPHGHFDATPRVECNMIAFQSGMHISQVMIENMITLSFTDSRLPNPMHPDNIIQKNYVLASRYTGSIYPAPAENTVLQKIVDCINEQLVNSPYCCKIVNVSSALILANGVIKRPTVSYEIPYNSLEHWQSRKTVVSKSKVKKQTTRRPRYRDHSV